MQGVVPPYGPMDAPIVWLGEAPGRMEVIQGRPFVGASGWECRKALQVVGVDPDKNVYWTNCVRINPGTFPQGRAGATLLKAWAEIVDREMSYASGCRVLVLCGGQALRRMTGLTSIGDWHASVLRPNQVVNPVVLYATKTSVVSHNVVLPPRCEYIIPLLHPAGILRSKDRKELVLFRRGVQKVAMAALGELHKPVWEGVYNPSVTTVRTLCTPTSST